MHERTHTRGRSRRRRDLSVAAFLLGATTATALVFALAGHLPRTQAASAARAGQVVFAADSVRPNAPGTPSRPPAARPRFASAWLAAHPAPELGTKMAAAIVVDIDANQVLWERGGSSRRAPASLAKLMTAMVVADHASMDQAVTVPVEATQIEPNWMGLTAGEVLSVRELLYGLFLDSGNDAAETLARGLMPRDTFIAEMNAKGVSLGMRDTHFSNPSGLDDPGLYSTPYDIALMGAQILDAYPELAAVAATSEYPIPATATHKAFDPYNLNGMVRRYAGAVGLKTGFTDDAGGCLAAAAMRGGRRLVAVVLDSDVFVGDATKLLDYGFSTQLRGQAPIGA